jgi:Serine/threonine protein kinase
MSEVYGYKIVKSLGEGSFGQVFEVQKDGKRYAMKITRGILRSTAQELDVLSRIKHPNIVRLVEWIADFETPPSKVEILSTHDEFTIDSGRFIYIMELADGDLETLRRERYFSEEEALRYFYEICSACITLHEGSVVHCDLKTNNILIKDNHPLVSDLGIVRYVDGEIGSKCQNVLTSSPEGLVYFHLPETDKRFLPWKNVTWDVYKGEVWVLGLIFVYLMTGKHLFNTKTTMKEFLDEMYSYIVHPYKRLVELGLRGLFLDFALKALDSRPERRYARVEDFFHTELFLRYGYELKIPGQLSQRGEINKDDLCTREVDESIHELRRFTEENGILLQSYFLAIDIFLYLVSIGYYYDVKICLLVANSLYNIDNFAILFAFEDLREVATAKLEILQLLEGKVYNETVASSVFSVLAANEVFREIDNCQRYIETNKKEYIRELFNHEKIEDRENRTKVNALILSKDGILNLSRVERKEHENRLRRKRKRKIVVS